MGNCGTIVFNTFEIQQPTLWDVLGGMRSTFNLSGSTQSDFAFSDHAGQADLAALECDWVAVATDLRNAMDSHIGAAA